VVWRAEDPVLPEIGFVRTFADLRSLFICRQISAFQLGTQTPSPENANNEG
jgi:hypothetical protein